MSKSNETVSNAEGATLPAPTTYTEAVTHWVWGFGPNEFPKAEPEGEDIPEFPNGLYLNDSGEWVSCVMLQGDGEGRHLVETTTGNHWTEESRVRFR